MLEAYFMLSGRMRRKGFLGYSLLFWVVLLGLVLFTPPLAGAALYPSLVAVGLVLLGIAFWFWAGIALVVKRLHDLGRPGAHYVWMFLTPGILVGIDSFFDLDAGIGRMHLSLGYGPLAIFAAVWLLLAWLYLVVAPGSDGPNRFGYPP